MIDGNLVHWEMEDGELYMRVRQEDGSSEKVTR